MAAFQKLMVVEPQAAKQTVVAIKYVDVTRLVVALEPYKKETTSAFAFHQMGYRFQSNLEPDVLPVVCDSGGIQKGSCSLTDGLRVSPVNREPTRAFFSSASHSSHVTP
jgi:hypothetical protein